MKPAPDLKTLKFGALLNTASGSCDPQAARSLEEAFQAAGLRHYTIWRGDGGEVDKNLDRAAAAKVDALVVLGGDGTIRAAAERCGRDGALLVALPGGTMNMLPKTLYGQRNWRDALKATLATPMIQPVHGGQAAGHRFFVAAIFGEPTRFADAREAVRGGDLVGAIGKGVEALSKALEHEVDYRFTDTLKGSAEAIAVVCPLTSAELPNEAEVLEVAAIDPEGPVDALRLALRAAFSGWRSDPTVARAKIEAFDLASKVGIPALLDGERFMLPTRVRVELVRDAFTALRPAEDG